jgi:imidazolonepropionase-like amidohydrolase
MLLYYTLLAYICQNAKARPKLEIRREHIMPPISYTLSNHCILLPRKTTAFLHRMIPSGGFIPVNCFRRSRVGLISLVLYTFCSTLLSAQAASQAPATETGKFRLHKFEQAIGEETYTVTHDAGTLTLKSDFAFTDRGSKVPLSATLKAADDYTPQSFNIQGKTSRLSTIDSAVEINGSNATIRQGSPGGDKEKEKDAHVPAPQTVFTISGYAPVAMQMALIRYWRLHGSPAHLAMLPSGDVQIQDRGAETIEIDGRGIPTERFTIRGLIWGMETLWMEGDKLAALVSTDAEFDHFEAVREEYEPGLAKFVASAARDEMAALSELGQSLPGRRSGSFAFVGATVINTTGKQTIANATVVTRDGKIVAVGPSRKIKLPPGAQRIDVAGKFIIPGLWDMHAHYEQVEWGAIYLGAGVTTVRDVGNEFEFITAVRDAVNSGKALGPHMLLAGIVDGDSPMALGIARVNSPADAHTWVQRYHDAGFQQMKIYSSVKSDNVKAICEEAHRLGMTVTGHIPNGMTAYDAVNDGMDQINHIDFILDLLEPKDFQEKAAKMSDAERAKIIESLDVNSEAGKQAVKFLKEHKTVIDPTMALMEFIRRPADVPADKIEPGVDHVAPELREQLVNGGMPPNRAATAQKMVQEDMAIIGALHRAGVRIVAGTDQMVPGYSLYREIELYNQAGFTPLEALQAATIVPARVMQADGESGSIEVGKRADLDILDANPLADIHNIRAVRFVIANGVLFESAPLWRTVGFNP